VIRGRLENREVAVVGVRKVGLEVLELLGNLGQLAHDLVDELAAEEEVQLDPCAAAQVQVAHGEEAVGLVTELQDVVVGLLHVVGICRRRDLGKIV